VFTSNPKLCRDSSTLHYRSGRRTAKIDYTYMEVVINSWDTGILQVVPSRAVGCAVQMVNPKVDNQAC
jgi:hypothetical protein